MRSRLAFVKNRLRLARHNQGGPGGAGERTEIQLNWVESSGGTVDAVTNAVIGATEIEMNSGVPCFIHDISERTQVRQFAEIQEGDVLVDVDEDLDLNLPQLTFELNGRVLHSKEVHGQLAAIFDVQIRGRRLTRVLHLREAT